ncbi:PAQR family membrane homeostasis protein TrhA [Opitutus terrae]|uniref:Channel protein, hemolysin III family n=1 Tax=Opitutus terrae (strain DSM 11246 / JCM 15787 / PB90-1) TaxID=452637 RepID=B1ZPI9_OPITP|nr:hemolysin III family protein [Opitutus terrae]ACB74508.1 channel protein, hemolysin III family [Opitutus terrae PB90-1]
MPPQNRPPAGTDSEHEEFSLPLFVLTVLATLAGLLAGLRLFAPQVWAQQFLAPVSHGIVAFLVISLINCFMEYFFHRYVLHLPAVPFLRRLYKQHTLHHALTRIARRKGRDGRGILFIENKFPIVEPEQGEASFFPWYSLAVFALILTPLLALLQWLLPAFPWFLAGFAAIAVSLTLYELLHAINHWPFEQWEPLIQHPRWGRFWQPAYGFHLRHHAVTDCNESISGFFGLPVADWVFGTCVVPQTVYAEGEEWSEEKFRSPHPRWIIRRLDAWAERVVQRRRASKAVAAPRPLEPAIEVSVAPEPRVYTRWEEAANWITHGIGLVLSVAGLTLLIVFSSLRGDAWHVVSFTVFGLTLLALYAVSTIYHLQRSERAKYVFRKLDHAAIFLLIAGTYTPFLLTSLRGPWGWTLFGVIWGLCGAGAVFQLFFGERYRLTSTVAYLFVGWLIVVALEPLTASVPHGGLWLLLAGGLCYTFGVVFYHWHRLRFHHAVWHAFVVGGSTCHVLAVLLFLLPSHA